MSASQHLVPNDISAVLRVILRWKPLVLQNQSRQLFKHGIKRIGICVSGGPDSMALTYLLHHMPHPYDSTIKAFDSHAFIVDHGMRSGSTEEAAQVKQNLAALGVESSIIDATIAGATGTSKELKSFQTKKTETNARDFRYQAIIAAARQKNIHELFLGHHHDDQMETLLMRMVTQRSLNLSALQGMQLCTSAPHTVQGFGSYCREKIKSRTSKTCEPKSAKNGFDDKGIKLFRPLLEFPKTRLIATCEKFGLPFVSDRTNLDPTYTLRNAIRYLRSHVKLPQALQDSSLMKMRNHAVENADLEESAGKSFTERLDVRQYYTESGMIQIAPTKSPSNMTAYDLLGAGYSLARFCDLLSPVNKDTIPPKLSQDATNTILALLGGPTSKNLKAEARHKCHFQTLKLEFRSLPRAEGTHCELLQSLQISRQPMRRSEISANTHVIRMNAPIDNENRFGQWINWDNRFWIRVKNESSSMSGGLHLVLRPYQPQDVRGVRKLLATTGKQASFEQRLQTCAPGDVKYTLPVFVVDGTVVAFPTFDTQLVKSLPFSSQVTVSQPQRATAFFGSLE